MKYKNYIDNTYYALYNSYLIICFILSVLVIILNVNIYYLSFGIFTLIFTLIFTHFLYSRYYFLGKEEIIIKVGFIKKKYDYKKIKKCFITEGSNISYATSKKRICISFKNYSIYISPEKMDEVLLALIKKTGGKKK